MTPIAIIDRLPFIAVTLQANNRQLRIDDVLLDTGAAASVFRTDDLASIGIVPEQSDRIRFMSGIGGREAVIEKQIERIEVGDVFMSPFIIQLGVLDYGFAINGILGMDFLLGVGATIDFRSLTLNRLLW